MGLSRNFCLAVVFLDISERKKRILRTVVEEYIETAEPVGSKTVQQKAQLDCSPATIRNELADLCVQGYLEQPHTSAGRIPTAKGYRLYVNELMREQKLSLEETETINRALTVKMEQLDKLISDVGHVASELTSYPALAFSAAAPATIKRFDLIYIDPNTFIIVLLLSNDTVKNKLIHLPFSFDQSMVQKLSAVFNGSFTGITEDKITPLLISSTERAVDDTMGLCSVIAGFVIEVLSTVKSTEAIVSGEANLLKLPEFKDPEKAHKLINYLSDSANLSVLPAISGTGDVRVIIGPENVAEELKDSSVVLASYNAGDNTRGLIGVVGPTRMDYSKVAAKLSYIADGLSKLLGGGGSPPPGFGKLMIKGDDPDV
ncbi:MAG: heat-inducible transcriptional repressor HrcA [Oscillospiraceae bacterium]